MKDIIFLVADTDMKLTLDGILSRPKSLSIRAITYDVKVHPHHDPGCLKRSHFFLQIFRNQYEYACVIFDREGCGKEESSRDKLEQEVENLLSDNGWKNRCACIVPDPELEIWVWSDSPHIDEVFGWKNKKPDLRSWMLENRFLQQEQIKPHRPKETLERALRIAQKPRSSSLYFELAQKVSFNRCGDSAFLKFRNMLKQWFSSR